MDLSKLPRLSESNKDQPPAQPAVQVEEHLAPQVVRRPEPVDAPIGGEVWISIVVGAILLFMQPRFMQWVFSRVFGTHFNEFIKQDGSGTIVPYTQVPEFWGDLGPTLFAIVLIVEGIALAFSRNRMVVAAAFGLTVLATAYNLVYLVVSFSTYGLPIISALAVAFGVYIAMYQWNLLKAFAAVDGAGR